MFSKIESHDKICVSRVLEEHKKEYYKPFYKKSLLKPFSYNKSADTKWEDLA